MSYVPDDRGQARAFLLSVLGSAAAVAVVFTAFILTDLRDAGLDSIVLMFLVIFLVAGFVMLVVAAIVGLPLTYILAEKGLERSWTYPIASLIVGTGVLVGIGSLFGPLDMQSLVGIALTGGLPGAFCGAIWWFSFRSRQAVRRGGSPT